MGNLLSVEFFSPSEVFESASKQATQSLLSAAERAPAPPLIGGMEPTAEMTALRHRIDAATNGEDKVAYERLLAAAEQRQLAYYSS